MQTSKLKLKDLVLITPRVFKDDRGFFLESYRGELYQSQGIDCQFVQDNHSFSTYGCIRGMHFQSSPGQAKLIRCAEGKIFDVAVDIRKDSPTFGEWESVILDSENHEQLFIPAGFAHGFCVLSDHAHVTYKVSSYYNPETETGFRYDDPDIGIKWPITEVFVSERDKKCGYLKDAL